MVFHISLSILYISSQSSFFFLNRKIRLDNDHHLNHQTERKISPSNQSSLLLKNLNNELDLLSKNRFSIEYIPVSHTTKPIELDDDYLSKNGLVLRCKLLEPSNPLIPPLRLRISTRYPDDQPEILSLTKSMSPKLEFTGSFFFSYFQIKFSTLDGHEFFEQLSKIFVSQLFKLPSQHTITDILNIWVNISFPFNKYTLFFFSINPSKLHYKKKPQA